MAPTFKRSSIAATAQSEGKKRRRNPNDTGDAREEIKRLRTTNGLMCSNQEFGAMVPSRLARTHGPRLRPCLESIKTILEPHCRPLSPDWIDAFFLGDRGFFLTSWYGICYYVWRSAMLYTKIREQTRSKSASRAPSPLSKLHGQIPTFHLPLPEDLTLENTIHSYTYIYRCWFKTVFHAGPRMSEDQVFKSWLMSYLNLRGVKDMTACWRRIGHFFQHAYLKWKVHPSADETIAYLRATEEFWFQESYIIEEKEHLRLHVSIVHGPNGMQGWKQLFLQRGGLKNGIADDNTSHCRRAAAFGVATSPRLPAQRHKQLNSARSVNNEGEETIEEANDFMSQFFDFYEAAGEVDPASKAKPVEHEAEVPEHATCAFNLFEEESFDFAEAFVDLTTDPYNEGSHQVNIDTTLEPVGSDKSFDELLQEWENQHGAPHDNLMSRVLRT